ncbi:uncharacterized protein CDAR_263291 [Caerostris darwini]|uniref:Uncharacterized protein n=1 Tax=Caerostris darwini TaxID=1538125 RepID=A0AAV4RZC2_9ARAC|nr:uncharacterized protein CDAR_263291 [Caerostris darwini]
MQSCLEYHQQHHHPQGSPHVTYRHYSPQSSSPPHNIKEEEPSGALTTPASGSGGPTVSSGGGGFYGSPHCYLPASKKGDALPRLGMLGGSTPGMYSKALVLGSPAPDTHGKSYGLTSSANSGLPSPSGFVHWMSMMSEHVPTSPHESVYSSWNGVESCIKSDDGILIPSVHLLKKRCFQLTPGAPERWGYSLWKGGAARKKKGVPPHPPLGSFNPAYVNYARGCVSNFVSQVSTASLTLGDPPYSSQPYLLAGMSLSGRISTKLSGSVVPGRLDRDLVITSRFVLRRALFTAVPIYSEPLWGAKFYFHHDYRKTP